MEDDWGLCSRCSLDSGECHEMISSFAKLTVHEREMSEVSCMSKLTERGSLPGVLLSIGLSS